MSKKDFSDPYNCRDSKYINNATTGLMILRDLLSFNGVRANVSFDNDGYILVELYYDSKYKYARFYLQDMYEYHSERDMIYEWVKTTIKEMKGDNK